MVWIKTSNVIPLGEKEEKPQKAEKTAVFHKWLDILQW